MTRTRWTLVILGVMSLACAGLPDLGLRATQKSGKPPKLPHVGAPLDERPPSPPFALNAPSVFEEGAVAVAEDDTPEVLYRKADDAFASGDVSAGITLLDHGTRRDALPTRGFELSRRLANAGEIDACIYWLSLTALEYGVHAEWLIQHREFQGLWRDPRWEELAAWLVKLNRYYRAQPLRKPRLVLPETYRSGTEIPLLIWFPALGQRDPFETWAPEVANRLNIAIISVRGNIQVGPEEVVWSGSDESDREYVRSVVKMTQQSVRFNRRRIHVSGSGQGAQFAIEFAAREPELVGGIVALSPSGDVAGSGSKHDKLGDGTRRAVLIAGPSRDPSDHTVLRQNQGRLKRLGDQVTMQIDRQPWNDRLPADFPRRFVTWLDFVIYDQPAPW